MLNAFMTVIRGIYCTNIEIYAQVRLKGKPTMRNSAKSGQILVGKKVLQEHTYGQKKKCC